MNNLLKRLEQISLLNLLTATIFISFIVYGPSLFNGFVWDDEEQILNNISIKSLSYIPLLFGGSTFNSGGAGAIGIYYKPLMSVSYALNYALWGANAFGFHLFSLVLHTINSILLFILFRKLFLLRHYEFSKIIPFIFSLIFLIHPANSESVAYIASVQELLYVFFLLVSLLLTLSWCLKPHTKKLFFINTAVLLSLLSKDSALVDTPIIIALVYLFYKKGLKRIILYLLLTLGLYIFLRFNVGHVSFSGHQTASPIVQASLVERLQTIPYELFSYIRIIFFPKDLFISQHFVIHSVYSSYFFLLSAVVLLTISCLFILAYKLKSSVYNFFLFWVAVTSAILLNIYPLDMTLAERWLYAPLIGFLGLLCVATSYTLRTSKKIGTVVLIIIIIYMPLLGIRTMVRNADWKDNLTLFSHDLALNKSAYDLESNYGTALFRAGNLKDAKTHFERSIQLEPHWATSYNNLGVVYQREKNIDKAKEFYEKSLKNADYYLAYENLAVLKVQTEASASAIAFLKQSVKKLPYNPHLNYYLAYEYYQTNATESAKPYAQNAYLLLPNLETYTLYQQVFWITIRIIFYKQKFFSFYLALLTINS